MTACRCLVIILRLLRLGAARVCMVACALPGVLLGHNSFEDRLAKTQQALAEKPADAALHYELAEIYCIEGHAEWELALAALAKAEALAPGRLPFDLLRGKILIASKRPTDAVVALDRHILAHPDQPAGFQSRARARRLLGQDEASLADYRTALRLSPRNDPNLIAEAAEALTASGQRDEAADLLADAIGKLGPLPHLLTRALDVELALGRFDAAISRAAAIERIWPLPERWRAKRAEILAQAGRSVEARQAWQALVAHIDALPPPRRGSEAMHKLKRQALEALATADLTSAADWPKR